MLLPVPTLGAVQWRATATGGGLGASPKTFSASCPINSKNNVMVITTYQASLTNNVTGVTYAGSAATLGAFQPSDAGINYYAQGIWYVANAAGGTNSVTITTSSGNVSGIAECYSGARQTGSIDSIMTSTAAGTPLTFALTTISPNSLLFAAVSDGGGTCSAGAGSILRQHGLSSPSSQCFVDSQTGKPSGSNSISVAWSGGGTAGGVAGAIATAGDDVLRTQQGGSGGIMGW